VIIGCYFYVSCNLTREVENMLLLSSFGILTVNILPSLTEGLPPCNYQLCAAGSSFLCAGFRQNSAIFNV
jgi:hypothetical protein